MRTLKWVALAAAAALIQGPQPSEAGPCCAKKECCCECRTVMKTCQEVVCEYYQKTCYKTVYEEVKTPKQVDAIKYEEQTLLRDVVCCECETREVECPPPCTCCQPRTCCHRRSCCDPCKCCEPCKPRKCCVQVCKKVIKKVPYTAVVPVKYQKTEEVVSIVAKQVPYTVTICKPKVVCKQVPVKVCCPVPCCSKPSCCEPCCSGQ